MWEPQSAPIAPPGVPSTPCPNPRQTVWITDKAPPLSPDLASESFSTQSPRQLLPIRQGGRAMVGGGAHPGLHNPCGPAPGPRRRAGHLRPWLGPLAGQMPPSEPVLTEVTVTVAPCL